MAKQRTIQLSIAAVMVAMAAVFFYIFMTNIQSGEQRIDISLPGGDQGGAVTDAGGVSPELDTQLRPVEVTTGNVQSVIMSMHRPEMYFLSITATNYFEDVTMTRAVDHWVRGVNSRTKSTAGDVTSNTLQWEDKVYLWNTGDMTYTTYPKGEFDSDAAAAMLTYEDVVFLPSDAIAEAGYVTYKETPCIYLAADDSELGYRYTYYVALETGMLIHGEITKGGEPIYTMNVTELSVGVFDETVFMLPDGQPLIGQE